MARPARYFLNKQVLDNLKNLFDVDKKFYTYILFSISKNRYYIGQTDDIKKRIERHNKGRVISTKPYLPWILIGYIEKETRHEVILLERKLKNLNTEDLKKFIKKYFDK